MPGLITPCATECCEPACSCFCCKVPKSLTVALAGGAARTLTWQAVPTDLSGTVACSSSATLCGTLPAYAWYSDPYTCGAHTCHEFAYGGPCGMQVYTVSDLPRTTFGHTYSHTWANDGGYLSGTASSCDPDFVLTDWSQVSGGSTFPTTGSMTGTQGTDSVIMNSGGGSGYVPHTFTCPP